MKRIIARYVTGNASFWGLVEYGSGPLLALVALPILFRQLGTTGFGQYAMIVAVAGFGNVANLGSAVTATKLVSEQSHEPGSAHRAAGVALALTLCTLAGVAAAALAIAGAVAWGWPQAGFGDTPLYALVPAALCLYVAQQLDQLFAGALKGSERFASTALCESGGRLVTMMLACSTAWLSHSALLVAFAQGAGLLLAGWVKMRVFARADRRHWVRPVMDRPAMASAFRFSCWSWLHGISTLAFSSLDRVLVGTIMGPASLAIYTVGVQVGQLIHTASVAVFQKAMPRVSRLCIAPPYPFAAGDEIRRLMAWNAALSVGATLALLAVSQPLLKLMLGADHAHGQQVTFDLLILASGALSLNTVAHFSLLGLGNGRAVALLNGAGGMLMLGSMALLFGLAGQNAAAIGRIAYALVTLAGIGLALRQSRTPAAGLIQPATR